MGFHENKFENFRVLAFNTLGHEEKGQICYNSTTFYITAMFLNIANHTAVGYSDLGANTRCSGCSLLWKEKLRNRTNVAWIFVFFFEYYRISIHIFPNFDTKGPIVKKSALHQVRFGDKQVTGFPEPKITGLVEAI